MSARRFFPRILWDERGGFSIPSLGFNVRRVAALALCLLAVAGCTKGQRELWCRTINLIDGVIKPAVKVALPVLAPQLADRYNALVGAVDAASGALLRACVTGDGDGPALDTAVQTSIDLLAWWQEHRAEVAAAAAAPTRDLGPPDDCAEVLAKLEALQARRARK